MRPLRTPQVMLQQARQVCLRRQWPLQRYLCTTAASCNPPPLGLSTKLRHLMQRPRSSRWASPSKARACRRPREWSRRSVWRARASSARPRGGSTHLVEARGLQPPRQEILSQLHCERRRAPAAPPQTCQGCLLRRARVVQQCLSACLWCQWQRPCPLRGRHSRADRRILLLRDLWDQHALQAPLPLTAAAGRYIRHQHTACTMVNPHPWPRFARPRCAQRRYDRPRCVRDHRRYRPRQTPVHLLGRAAAGFRQG
mmetsp:Transcript_98272/g.161787  ORF Transcript_98272/g.161787 Transcript_98272/m.161787 type:complete len:255 (-) Transcript_98272:370-1134(-)